MTDTEKQIKVLRRWAGFVDGKIDQNDLLHCTCATDAIFKTKKEAKRWYRDVRKVELVIRTKVKP